MSSDLEPPATLTFVSRQSEENVGRASRTRDSLPNCRDTCCARLRIGTFVHRIPAVYFVSVLSLLSAGAPLLMVLINPRWPYWYDAFFARLLGPFSSCVLFTIGMLVISEAFSDRTQGLASGVFNTVIQMGQSVGLTTVAVISRSAAERSHYPKKSSPEALMVYYRASFWAAFAWMLFACLIGGFGLRKVGKVGLKGGQLNGNITTRSY